MSNPSPRSAWVSQRVEQLMLDPTATVELLEDVQARGGPAHQALCRGLQRAMIHPPHSPMHDYGLDMACQVLQAAAHQRATAEWERRP